MAFLGAILGAYLVSKLDQENWKERFQIEQQKRIFEKRMELIEKTSYLLSKSSLMEALEASINGAIKIIEIERNCLASGGSAETCTGKKDDNLAERSGKERFSINSDLSAAFTLSSIYFGPKTNEALRVIINDPWKSSDQERQSLISAMGSELNYSPSE
ncbi:hypothetical protein D3C78_598310 [compost metagenome]